MSNLSIAENHEVIHSENDILSHFRVEKQKKNGEYLVFCPSHNDQNNPNVNIGFKHDGDKVIAYCHRCKAKGEEIFKDAGIHKKYLTISNWGEPVKSYKKPKPKEKFNFDRFIESKKLSKRFIKSLGVKDSGNKIVIPYKNYDGQLIRSKHRWAWKATDGSRWVGDGDSATYGKWLLDKMRGKHDYLTLVEGESDCWTLWSHGIPGLGVPGCNMTSYIKRKDIEDFNNIYIWKENGGSGKDFLVGAKDRLNELNYSGKVFLISGSKYNADDPSELHISNPDSFENKMERIIDQADKIDLNGKIELLSGYREETSTAKEAENNYDDFLPSPIANEIIQDEKQHGRLWKYVAKKDLFYFYDDKGYWRIQDTQYLKKYIREHLRSFNEKWDTTHRVKETISAMKSILLDSDNSKLFDASYKPNKEYINLKNGMLDWKNETIDDHDPEYYSQFQIPVEYNPEASCPEWQQAMKDWVPEEEARMFLQEFTGYCLIADTAMQKAVILTGDGSNGKSTFLNILIKLFGDDNLSGIPLHRFTGAAGRFETANIQSKLVNIMSDIDPTYLKETGVIKTLIAGEKLRGEYKHGASFDFTPVARLIFSANEIPKARDRTEAWYRRFEIVKFPNTFRKDDPNFDPYLEEKLEEELPGILNWSIEGLKRLKENMSFTDSEMLQEAKQEYERENDSVVAFIEDCTKYPADNYEISKKVYKIYKKYCEEVGLKHTARRTFTSKLKRAGFKVKIKKIRGKSKRCYYGLELDTDIISGDLNELGYTNYG